MLPPDTTDSFVLGQYYFNYGDRADGTYDLAKARRYFDKALEANPAGNSLAWYQLGRIDFLEGYFDDASYKFGKQLDYFGDSVPNVYYMLGLTYAYRAKNFGVESDWQKAEENFAKFLALQEDSPWARVDLAWVYFSQGKYEGMLPLLEQGLLIAESNPWLLNMYGLALLNTGDKSGAKEAFTKAKVQVEALTVEDWGKSYPGNDPGVWERGLSEFRTAIEKNLSLASF